MGCNRACDDCVWAVLGGGSSRTTPTSSSPRASRLAVRPSPRLLSPLHPARPVLVSQAQCPVLQSWAAAGGGPAAAGGSAGAEAGAGAQGRGGGEAGRQVGRVEQMETLNAMQKRSKGADTPKSGQAECPPPTLSAPASAGLTLPKGASAGDGGRNGRCASGSCARC